MIPGLYIHIPFCTKRCHYCDFYSIKTSLFDNENEQFQRFTTALIKEIDYYKVRYPQNTFNTIFMGGGTPSLLPAPMFDTLMNHLFDAFSFADGFEFTIECNPESLDRNKLVSYKEWGVNRISLGCQTFSDSILKQLGRNTNKGEIVEKYHLIRQTGFSNVNLDFIFGLVNQNAEDYKEDLQLAVSLKPNHFSCYGLTLGPKILKNRIEEGILSLPDEDSLLEEYLFTLDYLESQGYSQYEVSNFAQNDFECRHNLIYWQQQDYLGLGPSACGTMNGIRYTNVSSLKQYYKLIDSGESGVDHQEALDSSTLRRERIMLTLRTTQGLDIDSLMDYVDDTWFQSFQKKVSRYIDMELLQQQENQLSTTRKGLLVLDSILSELI